MLKLFITATDTDAGKTYVARTIVRALVSQQRNVAVYKPISAGCERIDDILVNEDAALLLAESNCQQSITQVNPIAFEPAIAPHIAANALDQKITLDDIEKGYLNVTNLNSDVVICEGAGGWRLPLGNGDYLSQFVCSTQQQVLLVVNMKLGCLNHAVLTYEAIKSDGLTCVGWIANCQEDMPYMRENIDELSQLLPIPKLGELAYSSDISGAAEQIDLSVLTLHFK